jgi:hypothetical protein
MNSKRQYESVTHDDPEQEHLSLAGMIFHQSSSSFLRGSELARVVIALNVGEVGVGAGWDFR